MSAKYISECLMNVILPNLQGKTNKQKSQLSSIVIRISCPASI